jgi:hypothetical protein
MAASTGGEHLAHLPDFEEVDALDAAFALALASPLRYAALRFFIDWSRLDLAEQLVVAERGNWNGARHEILAPAADALGADHPLAAAILYRALIDSILARARTEAYGHAARYYNELEALAAEETPDWPIDSAADYRAAARAQHGRKTSFWVLVDRR